MAEKQSIYNYKKGFLRIWILLSVIWVVLEVRIALINMDTHFYCVKYAPEFQTKELKIITEYNNQYWNDPNPPYSRRVESAKRNLKNTKNKCRNNSYFGSKVSWLNAETRDVIDAFIGSIIIILITPVVLWFVLLITINLTRRLFLWVRSGFKGE